MKNLLISVLAFLSAQCHAGFICNYQTLYTTGIKDALVNYQSSSACQDAVDRSKNGFICNYQTLYTTGIMDALANYQSSISCQAAVENSKP